MEEEWYLWGGIVPTAALAFLITIETVARESGKRAHSLPLAARCLILLSLALDTTVVNILLFAISSADWIRSVFYMVDSLLWIVLFVSYSVHCLGYTVFRSRYVTVNLAYVYKCVQAISYLVLTLNEELDAIAILEKIMALVSLLLVLNFILRFRTMPDYNRLDDEEIHSPFEGTFLKRWFFIWMFPLIRVGTTRPLEKEDAFDIKQEETAEYQDEHFERILEARLADGSSKRPLFRAVVSRFKGEMFGLAMVSLMSIFADMSASLFITVISRFLIDDSIAYWKGFVLLFYLIILKLAQAILNSQQRFYTAIFAVRLKCALATQVYKKTLRSATTEFNLGEVTNLMQVDITRITEGFPFSMRGFSFPVQITVSFVVFYFLIGPVGAIATLCTLAVLFVIYFVILYQFQKIQKVMMAKKDVRMKYCTELLNNIKIFKLYNWEQTIADRARDAREEEMKYTRRFTYILMSVFIISWGARYYVIMAMMISMSLWGMTFDSGPIFSSLSIVQILVVSVVMIPHILNLTAQVLISFNRIQSFLQTKDYEEYIATREEAQAPRDSDVVIKNCSFDWEGETVSSAMKPVNLEVKRGELVAVVGVVGSGKTALLRAISGNMKLNKEAPDSSCYVTKNVAYVEQEAWIQNCTLRDNVIYGKEFNQELYDKVIDICELQKDIDILPGGDQTEIGEKGINLSGGQKARVAIARAIYKQADLILLDDPLAAVDAHVGQAIFQKCLRKYCKGRTVMLVTNGQQYLPFVDRILCINEGEIIEQGTYNELIDIGGFFANNFLTELKRRESSTVEHHEGEETEQKEEKTESGSASQIIEAEDRERGSVNLDIYRLYLRYCGGCKILVIAVICMIFWQASSMWSNLILAEWTDASPRDQQRNRDYYIGLFSGVSVTINIFVALRMFIVNLSGLGAATRIFHKMLNALLDAPVNKFYDITPIGRILNRISKDQSMVDQGVFYSIGFVIGNGFNVVFTICMCIWVIPWSAVIIPFISVGAYKLQHVYLSSSRELTRIESISRSPIIQNFGESMRGASTIRAFASQRTFIHRNEENLNQHSKIYMTLQGANCWLSFYMEMVGDCILVLCAAFIIATRGMISSGLAAMCLYNALAVPLQIYFLIMYLGEMENNMISVERVDTMAKTESEAPRARAIDSQLVTRNWPTSGEIEFVDLQMRYRDDTEIVLKGVNVKIGSMEKVGIVGRTGSGKSSLGVCLFRIVEAYSGKILIDGVDISEVGLDVLRQRISLIPQDPTLFEGTLRYNLDPNHQIADDVLLETLRDIDFYEDDILEKEIKPNGENLSVGQKQLVCIARALLRKSRIMMLDEATAAIDYKTDEMIQSIIRQKFTQYTVLTIAHRINTIMDYDKIIVMDEGVVKEFGAPSMLMEKGGIFASLAKAT